MVHMHGLESKAVPRRGRAQQIEEHDRIDAARQPHGHAPAVQIEPAQVSARRFP
jgi:hypothetical protein